MSKNLYIVPYDFTPVSEKALQYALFLGKHVHTEIQLLHLAKDKETGLIMKRKLDKLRAEIQVPEGVELSALTKVGTIFSDIGRIAKEEHAQLIIMGTHGKRGMQSFTGSHALKVIVSADCPFLVVQKNTVVEEIDTIAVPIDLTKESLQIVNVAGDMAHMLDAKVHVLAEKQSDEILNQRLQNRLSIVKGQYEDRNNSAEVYLLQKRNFYTRIIDHVDSKNCGMIAISYHTEALFPQFDNYASNLMMNKQELPLLILNSKQASSLYF